MRITRPDGIRVNLLGAHTIRPKQQLNVKQFRASFDSFKPDIVKAMGSISIMLLPGNNSMIGHRPAALFTIDDYSRLLRVDGNFLIEIGFAITAINMKAPEVLLAFVGERIENWLSKQKRDFNDREKLILDLLSSHAVEQGYPASIRHRSEFTPEEIEEGLTPFLTEME